MYVPKSFPEWLYQCLIKGQRFSQLKPNKVGYRFQPSYQDILDSGPFPNEENCEISRWEMGTLNYEGLAGFEACVDYLASLSKPNLDNFNQRYIW